MKKAGLLLVSIFAAVLCAGQSFNYDQGVTSFEEGDYESALLYFGRDISDNPKASKSYFYRAIMYSYQEQNSFALRDINKAIKYFSSKNKVWRAGAHQLRGDIYMKIGEHEKTLKDYSIAVKLTPKDIDLYVDRAQIYYEREEFKKAEEDYKKILSIDESQVQGWAGLGRNFVMEKRYTEAHEILSKLIKLNPEYPSGYVYRARAYFEQQKFDDAIEDIYSAFLLDHTDEDNRSLFIYYSKKNYPLSLSKINRQVSLYPEDDSWYYTRAKLYEGKSDFLAAVADYTKIMDLNGAQYKAWFLSLRAKCFLNAGMHQLAIDDYNESLSIDSISAYRFGSRADVKRLIGDYDGAIKDFTKAIEIEPREAWFYYKRGWVKDDFAGDSIGGLEDYNEAISIDNNFVYTYLNRGRLFEFKLKDKNKANADYLAIISRDTVVHSVGNCRQYALFHLGREDEAVEWMKKILEEFPTDGNFYDAACMYSLMNNTDDAIISLEHSFENGYRDFTHLLADDDLDNIRNTPRFKELVAEWKSTLDKSLKEVIKEKPILSENTHQTVTVPVIPQGSGTYKVACTVNELRLNFIFDTGASDISISQTEALFMLKNGYLDRTDIGGNQRYMDANGDIEIGTKVTLRKVDFGGLVLKNVSASIVNNEKAPLLFGQSALGQYGKIVIDNQNNTITITTGK